MNLASGLRRSLGTTGVAEGLVIVLGAGEVGQGRCLGSHGLELALTDSRLSGRSQKVRIRA